MTLSITQDIGEDSWNVKTRSQAWMCIDRCLKSCSAHDQLNKIPLLSGKAHNRGSKETSTVINSLMNYNSETPLPSGFRDQTLADDSVHFFHNTVQKIRQGLNKSNSHDNTASPDLAEPVPELGSLKVQTREEMGKVIKRWASETCSLDAIPTALLKNSSVFPIVLPTITDLLNASLKWNLSR